MDGFGVIRTALFVPGNRPERVDKAVATAADMVIIDLEDAVPIADKSATRSIVRAKIEEHAGASLMVRINALDSGLAEADLEAVVVPGLTAILVPKVEQADDVHRAHALLAGREAAAGLEPGAVALMALLETARGVERAFEIASASTGLGRPFRLAFGAADYSLDMGIRLLNSGEQLAYPRARIAVASRAAGLGAPLDTPFMIDLRDQEALQADIIRGRDLGCGGKLCIHPNQVEVCNRLYSPDEAEISYAATVVAAFEAAEAAGSAALQVEGVFIDYPVVARCRRLLERAAEISARQSRKPAAGRVS